MHKQKDNSASAGIVSIMVTMVMILVISLIVITFARITRREQRQALDRQLSTQAFYAAESGVNAVAKALKDDVSAVSDKSDCDNTAIINTTISSAIDLDPSNPNQVKVTCLLINKAPTVLQYENIATESQVVPINSTTGAISEITIKWQDKDGKTDLSGCPIPAGSFVQKASWVNCNIGILRVDLVPTNGSFTRNNLLDNVFTAFLYPSNSGGSPSLTFNSARGSAQGVIHQSQCGGSPLMCTVRITNPGLGSTNYYMRLRTLYGNSTTNISAIDILNNPLQLTGAQAIVDVTGKANDVLRRIQVRVPIGPNQNIPDFAAQSSGSLCKRYNVIPGAGGTVFLSGADGAVSDPTTNPCSIN